MRVLRRFALFPTDLGYRPSLSEPITVWMFFCIQSVTRFVLYVHMQWLDSSFIWVSTVSVKLRFPGLFEVLTQRHVLSVSLGRSVYQFLANKMWLI